MHAVFSEMQRVVSLGQLVLALCSTHRIQPLDHSMPLFVFLVTLEGSNLEPVGHVLCIIMQELKVDIGSDEMHRHTTT